MPEIMGIKDWHCVTRGQIRDIDWSPLLQRVLPLEEMRLIFGVESITRERAQGRRTSLQIGPVLLKKKKNWGLLWERWGFGIRGMLLCSTPPCTWAGWQRWRRCTRSWRRSRGRWRTRPGRTGPASRPASICSGGSPAPAHAQIHQDGLCCVFELKAAPAELFTAKYTTSLSWTEYPLT